MDEVVEMTGSARVAGERVGASAPARAGASGPPRRSRRPAVPDGAGPRGPRPLADRLGVEGLSAADLAAVDPGRPAAVLRGRPAVHLQPGSMAGPAQALCRLLVERHDGRGRRAVADAPDGAALLRRTGELPGSGAGIADTAGPEPLAAVRAAEQEAAERAPERARAAPAAP